MAAIASSGLMVTRTHSPKILRTLQRHAWPKPATGFMVLNVYLFGSPRSCSSTAFLVLCAASSTVFCTSRALSSCCVKGSNTVFVGGGGSGDEQPAMNKTDSAIVQYLT